MSRGKLAYNNSASNAKSVLEIEKLLEGEKRALQQLAIVIDITLSNNDELPFQPHPKPQGPKALRKTKVAT